MRFQAYPDCHVSSSVMYARIPDSHDILFLRAHVRGGTLIDVGANVGVGDSPSRRPGAACPSVRTHSAAAERARQNLALNGLNFEVHELAISDRTGAVDFEDEGGVSTCNRTVVGFSTPAPTRPVRCDRLDRLLMDQPPPHPVTVVKIDVEGHEKQVLRGMMECLQRLRPRLVMFEYLQRTDLRETLRLFTIAGYTVLCLTSHGPQIVGAEVLPLQDPFACPNALLKVFTAPEQEQRIAS